MNDRAAGVSGLVQRWESNVIVQRRLTQLVIFTVSEWVSTFPA